MLHLLLGRAGSGKSHWIRDFMASRAREGKRDMVLLVPEQFSFESERALLRRLHTSPAGQIEVLSFSRLATRVFQQVGGFAGRQLDDAGRIILMGMATDEVRDRLQVYSRISATAGFAGEMLGAVREWQQCAISPQMLSQVASRLEEGVLRRKLEDLSLLYGAYTALVAESYVDPAGELNRLYETLLKIPYFEGKTVAIDSFKGFTGQQMRILERIIATAQDTYVSLCCDTIHDRQQGMGLFSNVIAAARKLMAMADRHGVALAAPQILRDSPRFHDPALKALEENLYSPEAVPWTVATGRVTVTAAQTRYDEADCVARTIRRLVREEGLRYREIAVIARNEEDYSGILESAFGRYEIPCFLDRRVPVVYQPLMRYLLSAFAAVRQNFETGHILASLKTGLAGLSLDEISMVENYALVWDINHGRWHKEWSSNPDGATDRFGPAQVERLGQLNQLRRQIIQPLSRFSQTVKSAHTPRELAGAAYALLEDVQAGQALRQLGERLEAQGREEEASLQYRTWDLCMTMLGQIESMLRGHSLDFSRFCDLFERMAGVLDLGSVPQGIDEVSVGAAERMRPAQPKVVFLLGCNEGVFPASPGEGGLLSDAERARLIELEVPVTDRCESAVVEEKYLAYASVCAASERIYLSYCRKSPGGEAMAPSELVRQIIHILPGCVQRQEDEYSAAQDAARALEPVEAPLPAVEYTARLWRSPGVLLSSLQSALAREEATAPSLRALAGMAEGEALHVEPMTARELYGQDLNPSASGVEDYHRCRFYYFCKHGLRLRTLRTAGLDVSRKGILVHFVLEQLLTQYGSKGLARLSDEERKGQIHRLVEDYVERVMGGYEDKSSRFRFLMRRIEVLLDTLVEHLSRELAQSQFVTAACELRVDESPQGVRPIRIDLASGGSIRVGGIIDRLDIYRQDDVTYFRVVDYKTGSQSYVLEDVCEGLGLQMLLYLFAVEENGAPAFGDHLRPAGVLYMPAKRVSAAADGLDERDAAQKLDQALAMNGILLDDERSLRAMEPDGRGLFIPAVYTASGKLDARRSSVASLAFFGRLRRHIDDTLRAMGEGLHSGVIAPNPLDGLSSDACRYCDFGPACPLEPGEGHRKVQKLSAAQKKMMYEGGDWDAIRADQEAEAGD